MKKPAPSDLFWVLQQRFISENQMELIKDLILGIIHPDGIGQRLKQQRLLPGGPVRDRRLQFWIF